MPFVIGAFQLTEDTEGEAEILLLPAVSPQTLPIIIS